MAHGMRGDFSPASNALGVGLMRIACKVHGKPAMVVGYVNAPKGGKPLAIVITKGKLVSVRLKDIDLGDMPEALGLSADVVALRKKSGS